MNARKKLFLLLAGSMTAMLVVAAACGGGTSSSDKTATASAGGSSGGNTPASGSTSAGGAPSDIAPDNQQVLTVNAQAEPNTEDPQAVSYTYELTVNHQLFMNLFDQDPKTSQLTAWAAAEVPTKANGDIAADGVTYTVKLKPDLKWSDGSSLTAQDFVYGIIRGYDLNVSGKAYGGFITSIKGAADALKLDPTSATYKQDVQNALKDSVVAVDDHTLKLVAESPSNAFLSNFTLPITSAVKQSDVEKQGANYGVSSTASTMVTSGPFKIKEWVPKDHLTIVPNDQYTGGQKPYLKEVNVKFIEDANQAYNAYQAGQLDESNIPTAAWPGIKADSNKKAEAKQEEEFGTRWITVDVTIAPWNNKDFVIGMNQATDREAIANDVYFGLREAWTAPCVKAVLDCNPDAFSNLAFNLDKAKASIAKAYPNGNIPTVTLETVDDPTTKALATTLQAQWQKVGVKTNIVTTDQATLRADMKNHKAGTQITGWGMDYADPTDLWAIFNTSSVGGNNLGFYSRDQYDKLESQQDAELDPAKRKDILNQLQDFLAADPPVIQFAVQLRTDMYKPYVKGLVSSPFDYINYGDQQLVNVYIAKH
ncbi:MAG TPA: peptide ABC transporter substrate-binding protein [Dehalococcoidia bacterium]|nr:peptide ABC transporter substrate-binding protein [Dehalococcoidia bacterium]